MSDLLDTMLTGLKLIHDNAEYMLKRDTVYSFVVNEVDLLEIKGIAKELITRLEKA